VYKFIFSVALVATPQAAAAQTPAPAPPGHDHQQMMAMGAAPLGISAARNGSGTSWLPDESPMTGASRMAGPWHLMAHGNVFVQYIAGSGPRGDQQFGSINWLMGMAERPVGGGVLNARLMLSAEPATTSRCGYPNLAQTGELCRGEPLHDRQHPHDLFMEVAVDYRRAINDRIAWQVYGGPAGEPALGPVAFPHRLSAMSNPIAPISHHWLDSTHITFGVVTGAIYGRAWKAEASAFNGREPDDERYDMDFAALDSYSGRAWWLPSSRWAVQVSAGRLRDVEPADDEIAHETTRLTASVTYHRQVGQRLTAMTAAWGQNRESHGVTNAWLAEAAVDMSDRDRVSLRGEITGKTGDELVLDSHAGDEVHSIGKVQAGYARQLASWRNWKMSAGATVGVAIVPAAIAAAYGRRTPAEIAVFFAVKP
jgi:hypothetical protein